MLQGDNSASEAMSDQEDDFEEYLMALSVNAAQGTSFGNRVRMVADLYGQEVIILIDSGSSSNFISESLASEWRHWAPLNSIKQVRVANGDVLRCTHELVDCPVWISRHGFKMTLKILPLSCYDIILGINWLEGHNPMEVD
jgi:hypothetical protein